MSPSFSSGHRGLHALVLLCTLLAPAQARLLSKLTPNPNDAGDYYKAINASAKDDVLKKQLHDLIFPHTVLSYTPGVWDALQETGKHLPGYPCLIFNRTHIPDIYSSYCWDPTATKQHGRCGNYKKEGDCFNREHIWPKSWFGGDEASGKGAYTDLFELWPSDGYINAVRGNYPLGEVSKPTVTSSNGCKFGPCTTPGYDGLCFEQADNLKGDIARSHFYLATAYWKEWSCCNTNATNRSYLKPWAEALLRKWHKEDPVDILDIQRNNAIFLLQNNRNPFIDHPEWVDSISSFGEPGSLPASPSPPPSPKAPAPSPLAHLPLSPPLSPPPTPPTEYYAGINATAKDNVLKKQLHDLVFPHTVLSYTPGVWNAFETTGKLLPGYPCHPANLSFIPDVYSSYCWDPTATKQHGRCGNYKKEGDCFNREHIWPKSWFGGDEASGKGAYTDLFELWPSDGYINAVRGNYPLGEVSKPTTVSTSGCKFGPCTTPGYSGQCFEQADNLKGDIARSHFYLATAYWKEWSCCDTDATNGSYLKPWAEALLRKWHRQDPVDDLELRRNDAIFLLQKNRNPFIDHPEWVDSISSFGA